MTGVAAPSYPDEAALGRALIAEAAKKSGLVWLTLPGRARPRPAWHGWVDGALYVVSGGREQALPGLSEAAQVAVTSRSKDTGGRLVTWLARPHPVPPGTPEWDTVTPRLAAKRLNAPHGPGQEARWARESAVTRLEPTGEVPERWGRLTGLSR